MLQEEKQLNGFVMMGDSWLGSDGALANILSKNTDKDVHNVAIGGSTSENTLNQLNSFIATGGSFASGTTAIINLGINDFLQGKDRSTTENNLNQIVSILGGQGVNIVLSGAPEIKNIQDLQNKQTDPSPNALVIADLYSNVAAKAAEQNVNLKVVDVMPDLLANNQLIYSDGIHTNAGGQASFNAALGQALVETGAVDNMHGWGLSPNEVKSWAFIDQVFGEQVVIESIIQDRNNNYNNTDEIVKQFAVFREILENTPEIQGLPEDQREQKMVELVQDHVEKFPETWKEDLRSAVTTAPEPTLTESAAITQNSFVGPIDDLVNSDVLPLNLLGASFEVPSLQMSVAPVESYTPAESYAPVEATNFEVLGNDTNRYSGKS